MKKIFFLFVALALLAMTSCKDDSSYKAKTITGKSGETVFVISDKLWESETGSVIRKEFAQPQIGLPQEEPLLDLIKVPHNAFRDLFKKNRNIITTKISAKLDSASISYKKDVWAYPQIVIQLQAPDEASLNTLIKENAEVMIGLILKTEKKRLMEAYSRLCDRQIDSDLKNKHQLSMKVPKGFHITTDSTDFVWLRYETPSMSQGVFVWYQDYTDEAMFTQDSLIAYQDRMLHKYVPGPTKGSFMQTEHRLDPMFSTIKVNGNYSAEVRGLWTVASDYMGGPFVSLSMLDPIRNRIVTAMGWVYAPKYDKRNYLREVEAMIYSLTFPDQEAMKQGE